MKDQHGAYDLNQLREQKAVTEHNLAVSAEIRGAMVEMADDDGNRMVLPLIGFEFTVKDGGTRNPVMVDPQLATWMHGKLTSFLAQLSAQRMVQDEAMRVVANAAEPTDG